MMLHEAFDPRSGVRERLALLLYLTEKGHGDLRTIPDWIYNGVSDRWSDGARGFRVDTYGPTSVILAALAAYDVPWNNERAAMIMIGAANHDTTIRKGDPR